MKLKWPLWAIVTVWFILHGIGFFSLALGWVIPLGLIGGVIAYIVFGAFAQSVGYGIIVGKKTLEAWKVQSKSTVGASQPNGHTPKQLALDYLLWLAIPVIIYIPLFIHAIGEK